MSEDASEDKHTQEPLRPEQYEAANQAAEILYSYLLENGLGPGTEQLLADALGTKGYSVPNNIGKLVEGLLSVAGALAVRWQVDGQSSPQQIIETIRKLFQPYD